jgi:hypothetical protein
MQTSKRYVAKLEVLRKNKTNVSNKNRKGKLGFYATNFNFVISGSKYVSLLQYYVYQRRVTTHQIVFSKYPPSSSLGVRHTL